MAEKKAAKKAAGSGWINDLGRASLDVVEGRVLDDVLEDEPEKKAAEKDGGGGGDNEGSSSEVTSDESDEQPKPKRKPGSAQRAERVFEPVKKPKPGTDGGGEERPGKPAAKGAAAEAAGESAGDE